MAVEVVFAVQHMVFVGQVLIIVVEQRLVLVVVVVELTDAQLDNVVLNLASTYLHMIMKLDITIDAHVYVVAVRV